MNRSFPRECLMILVLGALSAGSPAQLAAPAMAGPQAGQPGVALQERLAAALSDLSASCEAALSQAVALPRDGARAGAGSPTVSLEPDIPELVAAIGHRPTLKEVGPGAMGASMDGSAEADPGKGGAPGGGSLADTATNPIGNLVQFQLQNVFTLQSHESHGYANTLIVQPVIPIEIPNLPLQVTRTTLPVAVTTPDLDIGIDGTTGLGDLVFLDVFVFNESWGMWGLGPTLTFPTATSDLTGQGHFQAGPTGIILATNIPNWQYGVLAYNQWSYAGDSDRADVNTLFFQPILTWHFKPGWYAGLGDLLWTLNWEDGGELNLPLSARIGHVTEFGKQPVNIFFEPFYTPVNDGPSGEWGFKLSFTLLFPKGNQEEK